MCYKKQYANGLKKKDRYCHNWKGLGKNDCQCKFMVSGHISNLPQMLSSFSSACRVFSYWLEQNSFLKIFQPQTHNYSSCKDVTHGVPQGSTLVSLFFSNKGLSSLESWQT